MRFAGEVALCAILALWTATAAQAAPRDFDWETYLNPNKPEEMDTFAGRLWIASATGGVTVFDTADSSFSTIHRRPGGLVSNSLSEVLSDGSGRIWFGSLTSGVSVLDVETQSWQLLTGFEGLPSDTVTVLARWGDSVWVGTPSGFAVFEGTDLVGRCNILLPPDIRCPLGSHMMFAIAPQSDGAYLGTPAGVYWFDGENSTQIGDQGTPGLIVDLAVVNGQLWALTGAAAHRWDPDASEWVVDGLEDVLSKRALRVIDGELYAVSGVGIYKRSEGDWTRVGNKINAKAVAMTSSGDLWAAETGGIAFLEGDLWQVKTAPGPVFDDVNSVAVGVDGEIWFTGSARTASYDGRDWLTLSATTTSDRLQRCDVHGLLVDSSGRVWFGHCCKRSEPDSCLVDRLARSIGSWRWRRFEARNIWRVASGGGSIWLAGRFEGLYRIRDGEEEAENIGAAPDVGLLSSNNLSSLAFEEGRGLWIGHVQMGVDLFTGGDVNDDVNWKHIDETNGLLSNAVRKIVVKGGEVWVGTLSGVSVLNPATMTVVRNYTVGPGGLTDRITDVSGLAVDGFGAVWVSTSGSGVYLIRNDGTVESFNSRNSPLSHDVARDIAYDPFEETVWVATFGGLTRIKRAGSTIEGMSADLYVFPSPYCPEGCDNFDGGPLRIGGVPEQVDGEIVDLKGQLVTRFFSAGPGDAIWDGVDSSGRPAGSGLYFVVARYGAAKLRAKFALVR